MWRSILDHGSTNIKATVLTPLDSIEGIIHASVATGNEAFPTVASNPRFTDLHTYQQKKTFAQGMFDLALLTANANQLRYILDSKDTIAYRSLSLCFISISLVVQILVAIMLIWNSLYDVKRNRDLFLANRINNLTVCGIFLITITNVFISVFSVESKLIVGTGKV